MLQVVRLDILIFKLEKTFNSNHHYKVFEDAPVYPSPASGLPFHSPGINFGRLGRRREGGVGAPCIPSKAKGG